MATQRGGRQVERLVVAEFNIDRGSSITHQYPGPVGVPEQTLAELMLPDGVHKRKDDWTLFFLNRDGAEAKAGGKEAKAAEKPKAGAAGTLHAPMDAFIYEYDDNCEGGWVLKGKKVLFVLPRSVEIKEDANPASPSTYVVTKHAELDYTQLEPMFSCVLTASGLALGFRFASATAESVFSGHIEHLMNLPDEPESGGDGGGGAEEKPFLYCLNRVTNHKDDTVRRGAVVKALAICSPFPHVHIFKPLMVLALDLMFKSPDKEAEILEEVYRAINSMDLSRIPILTEPQKVIRRNGRDRAQMEHEAVLYFQETPMKIKIPLLSGPDEVADYQVIPLVQRLQAGVMTLFNAVLAEKRIVFISADGSAEELVNFVLGTVGMMSPPLVGLVRRAFPYTNLAGLDALLPVPGYIAGVVNPMFAERMEWWDVLCDVATGKVTLNPNTMPQEKERLPHSKLDAEFYQRINSAVNSHYGDDYIKRQFEDYLGLIVDVATGEAEFATPAEKQSFTDANAKRIESWKRSSSFTLYEEHRKRLREQSSIKNGKVFRYVRQLRCAKGISDSEMLYIYKTFLDNISTEEQVEEFLANLPSSQGGLYPVAVSLFHPSKAVRDATVELFKRFETIQALFILRSAFFVLYTIRRLTRVSCWQHSWAAAS